MVGQSLTQGEADEYLKALSNLPEQGVLKMPGPVPFAIMPVSSPNSPPMIPCPEEGILGNSISGRGNREIAGLDRFTHPL